MSNYNRPIIPYGNSFYINIELKQFNKDSGEYEYFDITTCHDVKVNLICAQHNTVIPLQFELLEGYNYILKCFVDYRLLHTTSYGVMVEGLNADNMHWRWTMLPKEGLLVVNNTSGMNIPDDVTTVDLAGRVGWGIQTDADLTNYYTKTEVNTLLENVEVDLDDYYTKSEVDGKLDDKQETLKSGVNIKTVNGESILGEGNITIESGVEVEPAKIVVTDEEVQNPDPDAVYIVQKPIELKTINGESIVGEGNIEVEADTSEIEEQLSGFQTQISGHQTALESQATQISGMQTVLAGHQTAIENQSGADPGFIKVTNPNDSNKVGLVSSLITYYSSNIGKGAVIEGEGRSGQLSLASGSGSHSEGWYTRATGDHSHAEGGNTQATRQGAHAEGESTEARGYASHAEGDSTKAIGFYSHTEGYDTIANNDYEHASGIFNVSTKTIQHLGDAGNTLFSVGNGSWSASHNAFEIRQNGDIYYADTEKIDGSTVHYYDAPMIKLQDVIGGVQTAISGHQTAIQNQATEIGGMQTAISGYQTALETQATEISGMQSNISGMQTEISGMQTQISGHQTAIQNQATEISGMQTVLAGHQTALENQSGGGDQSDWNETDTTSLAYIQNKPNEYRMFIYMYPADTNIRINNFGVVDINNNVVFDFYSNYNNSNYNGENFTQTKYNNISNWFTYIYNNFGLWPYIKIETTRTNFTFTRNGSYQKYFVQAYNTTWTRGKSYSITISKDNSNAEANYLPKVVQTWAGTFGIPTIPANTSDLTNDSGFVTSTTSGLKIEVVSALPSSTDSSTIYIIQ